MINIISIDRLKHPQVRKLLVDFRRQQVSRFPINAYCLEEKVIFEDSRFPVKDGDSIKRHNTLGVLSRATYDTQKQCDIYTLQSRLIRNKKFSPENDGHYEVDSRDLSKIAKALKDFVKPYSAIEIASKNSTRLLYAHNSWITDAQNEFQRSFTLNRKDIILEAMRLQELGVNPQTPYMKDVMDKGIPAYKEMIFRMDNKYNFVHLYINPDETIQASETDENMDKYTNHNTYQNMAALPNVIQQHVAMLRIADRGTLIPTIGLQVSDTEYWVLTPRK